jgi:hypothetical protein
MNRLLLILNLLLVMSGTLSGQTSKPVYASSSVLSSGKWFRVAVTADGIYRIDYSDLKKLGLENPSNPRLFGNNAGQLSYYNDNKAPDDLKELAIFTETGSDGIFNEGDYLLFYGQSPGRWIFDKASGDFDFLRHNYSDTAFYFITSGQVQGKRIVTAEVPMAPVNYYSEASDALYIHENETENLLHSGREWYQPVLATMDTGIDPGFTGIITTEPVHYEVRVLARASGSTSFSLSESSTLLESIDVTGVDLTSATGTYASISSASGTALPQSQMPLYTVRFDNKGESSAKAWLDYVKIHARKHNTFDGNTTLFTDSRSVADGNVTEFTIKSSSDKVILWDVTDPCNIDIVHYDNSGGSITFRSATDSLKTFIAFMADKAARPIIRQEPLPVQDLHSSEPAEMLIITHPMFRKYAARLAAIHNSGDGLKSLIATPDQIYNEFSGGIPDIAAIRNFVRMKYLRQKGTATPLKYVLLFGDGSYENKTPPPRNTNFIPTYQSLNSNSVVSSFTSDDFYSLLGDGEGEDSGTEDVGVGRIPVADTAAAATVVSKIEGYLSPLNTGSWKNLVCLVADDEDNNTHMNDAEGFSSLLEDSVPWINTDKIYFDAYPQVTSSTGQFYPAVTRAINDRINSGALIFNYVGHGNEISLGHERVVTMETIDQWKNKSKLPLFITATCEFSRFDDVYTDNLTGLMTGKNSAGEKILLSSEGGAIALMSTTRLVYSAPNYSLNRNILDVAFDRNDDGKALCLGDIIRIAKNISGSGLNKRNFLLLGDPALRFAYPWHGEVVTDSINSVQAGQADDTLRALSVVRVKGHIQDQYGNNADGFNGTVMPVVYGNPSLVTTLANDGGPKMEFYQMNNVLFSGKTIATSGKFEYEFMVPHDIDYNFGRGRISYYAYNDNSDMKGIYDRIITGGFSQSASSDTTGPAIRLFMNDTLFAEGGMTDTSPELYAVLEDNGGINTSGTGIGHDLTCWLDGDHDNSFILNSYFENEAGTYSKGKVIYGFSNLTRGNHILTLKAWDNFNNSSEKSISFFVQDGDRLILNNLINYPNPFTGSTKISVGHNKPDESLDVKIEIFDLAGKNIRILRIVEESAGFLITPVEWDGNDSNGSRAGRGLYLYRVTITAENGQTATISGRMIIL